MFVDTTLTAWGLEPICEDARLITSELSANAVLHPRTDFRVTLRSDGLGHLRIEVRDGTGRMSSPAAASQDAISGRGLVLVSTLATSWGTQMVSDGKVVWVELHGSGHAGGKGPGVGRLVLEGNVEVNTVPKHATVALRRSRLGVSVGLGCPVARLNRAAALT